MGADMSESDTRAAYNQDPVALNRRMVEHYRSTGGEMPPPMHGDRIVLLTTRGAKTGQERTTPLGFVTDGSPDRIVIYASNMAAPTHPAWYRNLLANPEVVVERGRERFTARATPVPGGPERDRLFKLFTSQMPGTDAHQQQTSRTIPMVVLEREGTDG